MGRSVTVSWIRGPGRGERDEQRHAGQDLGPGGRLGEPRRSQQREAERDAEQRGRGELAPGRPAGHVPRDRTDDPPRDHAVAVRTVVQDPDADPALAELAEQDAQPGRGRAAARERLGGVRERVQVAGVHDEGAAGVRLFSSGPGEGRGAARAEQPGQDFLGERVVPDADEDAFAGRPGRSRHGQQAGPGAFGRVDPAHAQGGQLAAQPGVRLARQHQGYRHAGPPSGGSFQRHASLCLHALFIELSLTQCSRRFARRPGGTRPRCPAPYPAWPG